jgi:hypothetical protein
MESWILSEHASTVVSERGIKFEWIELALLSPQATVGDLFDERLAHALRPIPEAGHRVLRVVYNATVSPIVIVTAFFDRRERRRREGNLQ